MLFVFDAFAYDTPAIRCDDIKRRADVTGAMRVAVRYFSELDDAPCRRRVALMPPLDAFRFSLRLHAPRRPC